MVNYKVGLIAKISATFFYAFSKRSQNARTFSHFDHFDFSEMSIWNIPYFTFICPYWTKFILTALWDKTFLLFTLDFFFCLCYTIVSLKWRQIHFFTWERGLPVVALSANPNTLFIKCLAVFKFLL